MKLTSICRCPTKCCSFRSIFRNDESENHSMTLTSRDIRTPKKKSIFIETAKDFFSSTTAHGLAYIVEEGVLLVERVFWAIVVLLAIAFCIWQVITIWLDWQQNPVVTSLETVALPIEEIEFPAVTICPQGSVNSIMSRVLMRQFKAWLQEKYNGKRNFDDLSTDEKQEEIFKFFNDTYPGTKDDPTKLAALMTSDDPKTAVENNAVLNDDNCDSKDNTQNTAKLNKLSSNDICPSGFEFLEYNECIHMADIMMTYKEAREYCKSKSSSQLLYFDSYKAVELFDNYKPKGRNSRFN